jgi:hypothetical protein
MKNKYPWLQAIVLFLMTTKANAQTSQPPSATAHLFTKMFPNATKVDWKEKTNNYTAFFNVNDQKCEAKFAKTGGWLSTEETIPLDSLPLPVQNAFKSSQYGDWNETSAYCIRSADGTSQYHLVLTKSNMGRKILFYSQEGKLLADH